MVIVRTKQAVREQLLKNSRQWVKKAFKSLQKRVTRSGKKNQQESAGSRNQKEALQEKKRSVLPPVEEPVIDDNYLDAVLKHL